MPRIALHRYVVGLGSNLGDLSAHLELARQEIADAVGTITQVSPEYRTAPVGAADQEFLNSAIVLETAFDPDRTMQALLAVETKLGRVRTVKWGNRTIDLDILLWIPAQDDQPRPFQSRDVIIPHPLLLARDFALVPAAMIAGSWKHPETSKTLQEEVAARSYSLGK